MLKRVIIIFLLVIIIALGIIAVSVRDSSVQNIGGFSIGDGYLFSRGEIVKALQGLDWPFLENIFPEQNISSSKVAELTNQNRVESDLKALIANPELDKIAGLRASDMFKKQYFAHISPSGEGVTTTAKIVGYDYLDMGENLALGEFKDETELVNAWMESPGHRKNILNPIYTEIGVASMEGRYEGENVWISVQVFARPASACTLPNDILKEQVNAYSVKISSLKAKAEKLYNELNNSSPHTKEEIEAYNNKVAIYNALVAEINTVNKQYKSVVESYNMEVKEYNECVSP